MCCYPLARSSTDQILRLVDEDLRADGVLEPGAPLQRLLSHLVPQRVHVLLAGRDVRQLVRVRGLHSARA